MLTEFLTNFSSSNRLVLEPANTVHDQYTMAPLYSLLTRTRCWSHQWTMQSQWLVSWTELLADGLVQFCLLCFIDKTISQILTSSIHYFEMFLTCHLYCHFLFYLNINQIENHKCQFNFSTDNLLQSLCDYLFTVIISNILLFSLPYCSLATNFNIQLFIKLVLSKYVVNCYVAYCCFTDI